MHYSPHVSVITENIQEKSNSLKVMNRNTPQQTQVYETSV